MAELCRSSCFADETKYFLKKLVKFVIKKTTDILRRKLYDISHGHRFYMSIFNGAFDRDIRNNPLIW